MAGWVFSWWWLVPLLFLALMFVCMGLMCRGGCMRMCGMSMSGRGRSGSARDALDSRYVRGEITPEEYRRLRQEIES